MFATEDNGKAELNAYTFNPRRSPYTVKRYSTTKSYKGGPAAGGYGYSQTIIDNKQEKIHVMFCGGQSGTGDFAWFTFDQRNRKWEDANNHASIGHRHCYLYGYTNALLNNSVVSERDVLLSDLGLQEVVKGADYAWG